MIDLNHTQKLAARPLASNLVALLLLAGLPAIHALLQSRTSK
jgi:hypothetical protein